MIITGIVFIFVLLSKTTLDWSVIDDLTEIQGTVAHCVRELNYDAIISLLSCTKHKSLYIITVSRNPMK